MAEKFSFTISRKTWLRGEGPEKSYLLSWDDPEPKMCCLGHMALACGYTEDEILNTKTPQDLAPDTEHQPKGFFGKLLEPREQFPHLFKMRYITAQLMAENDSQTVTITDAEREAELARLFALLDIEVTFVD